jgi:hypothetical protein
MNQAHEHGDRRAARTALPALDQHTLAPVVRRALDGVPVVVLDWRATLLSLHDGDTTRRAVYRVAGTAGDHGSTRPWSVILKEIRRPRIPSPARDDPHHWSYWKREALVYRSGLLHDLPGGLAAPRCWGVIDRLDDMLWIWLEDLADLTDAWLLPRYGLAARHLGAFNGIFLAGRPLPMYRWLSHDCLQSRSPGEDDLMALDPAVWETPLVRHAFPVPVVDRLHELSRAHDTLLRAVDRLPRTFCHLDAWRENLIACRDPAGEERTVAIDWAFSGDGAVGEEISLLVWVSLLEFKIDPARTAELEQQVLEGYLEGLHEAGWRGDPKAVRLGYLASSLLLWGIIPEALTFARDTHSHADWEQAYGRPIDEIVAQAAEVTYLLLDRVDEARRLLP